MGKKWYLLKCRSSEQQIILASTKNTDLSIKKTAQIQAGKTAGYIINSYSKQKTRSLRE